MKADPVQKLITGKGRYFNEVPMVDAPIVKGSNETYDRDLRTYEFIHSINHLSRHEMIEALGEVDSLTRKTLQEALDEVHG